MAHGLRTLRIARMRPLLDQRLAIPHEMIAPGAALRIRMAVDEREIHAFRLALDELLLHRLLRTRIFGEYDEARRVAIDPMHDERTPALRAQVAFELAVNRRFVLLARQRDREQPGRLVQHQQMPVLVHDVERNLQGASASAIARSGEVLRPSADAASNASRDSIGSSFAV